VATSVNLICAQRLVRRICGNCKEELEVPQPGFDRRGYTTKKPKPLKIYHGKGCTTCNKRATRAHRSLRVMEINDELRELILLALSPWN